MLINKDGRLPSSSPQEASVAGSNHVSENAIAIPLLLLVESISLYELPL